MESSRLLGLAEILPSPSGAHLPFLHFCAAWCFFAAVPCLQAAVGLYEVREVKPHVFVWISDDLLDQDGDPRYRRSGNAGFIITSEAVLVVDTTNNPTHARELLYEIRKRTELPVKYVINTDPCADHILGNEVFVDQQATIISSAKALAQILRYREEINRRLEGDDWRFEGRMRGIHITPPNQTFDGEMVLHLGSRDIRLLGRMPELDAGDTLVFLPDAKVLFLGSLYENEYFPRLESRDLRRWIQTLRQFESWDVETFVPGHGEPGGKEQLAEFREYLEWLLNAVGDRVRQGKSLAEVSREVVPAERFHWHAPELAAPAIEGAYHQVADQQFSTSNPKPGAPNKQ